MKILKKSSDVINEASQFGLKLIEWDTIENRIGDEHLSPLLFLRNIIELTNSISLLVNSGSIEPAKIILRSLIECVFSLEYMLEDNSKNRALSYLVWHAHKDLNFLDKLNLQSQIGKQFRNELEKDKLLKQNDNNSFFQNPRIKIQKRINQELLATSHLKPIEEEYQRTCSKFKNPNWYSLFNGPKDINQLAKYLKLNASYEILFRGYSDNVHSTDNLKNKLILGDDGRISLSGIRSISNLNEVTQNSMNFVLLAYINFSKNRIPDKYPLFLEWYNYITTRRDEIKSAANFG